jgi:tetratricopeptide (TPR) repeat protein
MHNDHIRLLSLVLAISATTLTRAAAPMSLQLEDTPAPLAPKQTRTQAETDRLEALALFAAGRMKEQAQDFAGALRLYQRALRYDPNALPVLEQIVPLAFNLNRPNEAVRYALKAVELDPSDPLLLRRLGVHLTEQGDFKGALKLYEKAQELDKPEKSAAHIVLRMEMGRLYFLTRRYKDAAGAFSEVVQALKTPEEFGLDAKLRKEVLKDPGKLYVMFAESFLEAGEPDKAIAAFEKAQEFDKDPAVLAYQMARVKLAAGDATQALAELKQYFAARSSEEGSAPYELLATVLEKLGRKADLAAELEELHKTDAANRPLAQYLANQYLEAKELDKAVAVLEALHKQDTSGESYRGLARAYRLRKQPEALLKLLGQLIDETEALDALEGEAEAIVDDEALVKQIIELGHKELKSPNTVFDYGQRLAAALIALDAKQISDAEEFFNAALAVNQKQVAEVLMLWGVGLLSAERYSGAAAVFKRGADERVLPKDNPAFYYYLSGALELDGQTDAALAAARKAVALSSDSPRIRTRVAWIQFHAKRYDDAAASYKELIERFDATHTSQEARQVLREARLVLSNIYVIKKDIPQAEEWLEQVLDEFPEDAGAMNDLGYLWADQGKNLARALEMARFAVEADPDNHSYHDSLGWALYKLEKYAEALDWLKKAASDEEPDAVILDHLGDCHLKLGQKPEALAAWRKALEAFDQKENAEEIAATKKKIEQHK